MTEEVSQTSVPELSPRNLVPLVLARLVARTVLKLNFSTLRACHEISVAEHQSVIAVKLNVSERLNDIHIV